MQDTVKLETKEREHKDVPLIEGKRGGSNLEEQVMRGILQTFNHSEMTARFIQSFHGCLTLNASKYFSQMLNGAPITLIFGVSDTGKHNGFPIDDFAKLQIQQIIYNALTQYVMPQVKINIFIR